MKFPTNIQEKASVTEAYFYEIFTGLKKFVKKIVYLFDGSIKEFPA